ncbi:MAG: methionine synthase [Ignavibacteriae bacterium]|nr:methionine synthase [Ignavibacteria bacterium]MBI3364883.1 methionine synthase [Ignavibacteriota bacterium]
MKAFLDILKEKIIVFDGAMGTNIQSQNLSADDFGGEEYNGCNEYLVLTKPSAVEKVHADFLGVGCDVIETDTFGGAPIVLAEYDLADQAYTLNHTAAQIAKQVASDFSTSDHPRFVAGSMGPTTKLPSLGHISFKEMENAFYIQAKGLIDGGVDLLLVETCQDLLQMKAALAGIFQYLAETKRKLPVIASVTIETMGTMLLGTEISAALTALEPYDINLIGMNCATGPKEMSENVRHLCANSPKPVFVMPNAGLPENVGGHAHYRLSPDEIVYYLSHFVKELGVNAVGGCCGTTKEHIKKLVDAVGSLAPTERKWSLIQSCSSLYQSAPLHIDPPPVIVGERSNANGSKMFRELLAQENWEGIVGMGKQQVKEGSHILDVCVAYVGRDEARDMRELIFRYNTQVTVPLMIDSTEPPVIEEALQRLGGKAIVNSINMEDGEERMEKVLPLCKKYGAAVIALTIDEQGMAKTVERKVEIARRIHALATKKYGIKEQDIIFDTLTFTLGSGDEEFRKSGIATIEAIRQIKKEFPNVHASLGVSNISFGLSPHSRNVVNSVFLHYAMESGLDMAIVHASKILPLYKISDHEREICRKLIFDERTPDYDPLQDLLSYYAGKKPDAKKTPLKTSTIEERLKNRIIEGDKVDLQDDLSEGLKKYSALDIINTILLDGMKVVGDLFGSGQMQLPFVLQSAEVMKAAVGYLEKFMDKEDVISKGAMVIATVKGDVHDIGKNLVDIILTNNGYKVINLGIQCPLDRMLTAYNEHHADVIGMSGLLVKSTLIMKQNLEVMNERGVLPPVILGGAALTRRYVEQDLRSVYKGDLFYANDAFDGLHYMEQIANTVEGQQRTTATAADIQIQQEEGDEQLSGLEAKIALAPKETHSVQKTVATTAIPRAPFFGTKVAESISLKETFRYINETALIRGQWQVRRGRMSEENYKKLLEEKIFPELRELQAMAIREELLQPKVVYGYFPCQSEGDDIIIYRPSSEPNPVQVWDEEITAQIWNPKFEIRNLKEWLRFAFPRQSKGRYFCISDFFASRDSGRLDVVGFHLVTMGAVASDYASKLFHSNNYKEYLYFHGLSVESAEALAELWHKRIREELDIHHHDAGEIKKLFSQNYQGSRYSFGYPACPSLEDQTKLFELLRPERIGVTLTEEYQLVPEQSTSAIIVYHPDARYFNI